MKKILDDIHEINLNEIEAIGNQVSTIRELETEYNKLNTAEGLNEQQKQQLHDVTHQLKNAYDEAGISIAFYGLGQGSKSIFPLKGFTTNFYQDPVFHAFNPKEKNDNILAL